MALMALMALMAHYHRKQRDGDRRGVEVRIKVASDDKGAGPGCDRHRFAVSEVDRDDLGKLDVVCFAQFYPTPLARASQRVEGTRGAGLGLYGAAYDGFTQTVTIPTWWSTAQSQDRVSRG